MDGTIQECGMNERIRELALQAGYTKDMFGVGHWDMPECKKFAELIVQECVLGIKMTMVRDGYDTKHYLQSIKHIDYIRKQFGVEE